MADESKSDGADVPQFFRLNIETGDLDEAEQFYNKLLGLEGRRQAGSRVYYTCGPVTLQVVDVSVGGEPHRARASRGDDAAEIEVVDPEEGKRPQHDGVGLALRAGLRQRRRCGGGREQKRKSGEAALHAQRAKDVAGPHALAVSGDFPI